METINITTTVFRQGQKKYLDKVREGAKLIIHSGSDLFQVLPVKLEVSEIDETIFKAIKDARDEYKKGNYVSCSTKEELHSYLDSL